MRKLTLYVETSVFGFYYDEKPENILKKRDAKALFEQVKKRLFHAFTSPLTIRELANTPFPYKERLLKLIEQYEIKIVGVEEDELETLFQKYMVESIVPTVLENDARHVAYATILKADILVSLNLEHIANEWKNRQFNAVNLKEGYLPITIRTPEEVIYHEI